MNRNESFSEGYNVFRSRQAPELHCAVPELGLLPGFLRDDAWEYFGRVNGATSRIRGFERNSARLFGDLNGFYVYQEF